MSILPLDVSKSVIIMDTYNSELRYRKLGILVLLYEKGK